MPVISAKTLDALRRPATSRTFRDPAGSVELRTDGAYRFIQPAYEAELLEFLTSPLAARLVGD